MSTRWQMMVLMMTLTACGDETPLDDHTPDAPLETRDVWCEHNECEPSIATTFEERMVQAPERSPIERSEVSDVILVPEDPTTPAKPLEPSSPNFPEARPAYIQQPDMIGEPALIAVHSEYNCAVLDGSVTCWGDNRHGQSLPPVNTRADHLSLASDYACAASRTGGIVCWGDGAWRVSTIVEDHTIYTRHTVSAFDASDRGVLCYNAGYGPTGQIICGDSEKQWTVGTNDGFDVSIGHLPAPHDLPIICHIEVDSAGTPEAPGYSYHCTVDGETWEIPAPNPDAPTMVTPQIEVGAVGESVTIMDQTGNAHWFKLSMDSSRSVPDLTYSLITIDTDGIYEADLSYKQLVTPHCGWTGTVVLCRDHADKLQYAFRAYGPLIGAHLDGDGITRCYTENGYDQNGHPVPTWISCAHTYWRYPW